MRNILIPTMAAVALAGCASQTQLNSKMAMHDATTLRASCGAPGTGDMNSPAFRECLSFFAGYVSGYYADTPVTQRPEGRTVCVTPKTTITSAFDKFREELARPSNAERFVASKPGAEYDAVLTAHMALSRAYPCK